MAMPSIPPAPSVDFSRRFTLRGTLASEERVRRDLLQISRVVRGTFGARLRCFVLVGGYARGEGAVEMAGTLVLPHNDYDLLVVVAQPDKQDGFRARRAGMLAQESVKVEVDIAIVSEANFLAPPPTLFWLDVSLGGVRWLGGDRRLLERQRPVSPRSVPLDEAGRLLANRAVGLALSRLGGEHGEEQVQIRHAHKAVAAAGDALLLAVDRYAPSLRERVAELERFSGMPALSPWLVQAYREALRFREDTAGWRPPEGLSSGAWFEQVLHHIGNFHMAFEAWRVGAPADPIQLAAWPRRLFEQKPDARLGDLGAGLRAWLRGLSVIDLRKTALLHPRERLARAAVAIAYRGAAGEESAAGLLGLPVGASHEDLRLRLLRLRAVGS